MVLHNGWSSIMFLAFLCVLFCSSSKRSLSSLSLFFSFSLTHSALLREEEESQRVCNVFYARFFFFSSSFDFFSHIKVKFVSGTYDNSSALVFDRNKNLNEVRKFYLHSLFKDLEWSQAMIVSEGSQMRSEYTEDESHR